MAGREFDPVRAALAYQAKGKEQWSTLVLLEDRVQELEEENARLRAELQQASATPPPDGEASPADGPKPAPPTDAARARAR